MLTRISAATAAFSAVLNAVVLLGWWNLDADQVTAVNIALVAVGAVVHSWFNPDVPVGRKA